MSDIVDAVKEPVKDIPGLPTGVEVRALFDQSVFVRDAYHGVLLGRNEEVLATELPACITQHERSEPSGPDFGSRVLPMREMHHQHAAWALSRCGDDKRGTCEALGVDYKTLMRHLT